MKLKSIALSAAGLTTFLLYSYPQSKPSDTTPPLVATVRSTNVPPDNLNLSMGEKLILQLETSLHTQSTREGDRATFKTVDEVFSNQQVVLPKESRVEAIVTQVQRPGRLKGRARIRLRFDHLILSDGTRLPFHASIVRAGFARLDKKSEGQESIKGERGGGGSVISVVEGAAQGAIMGGIFGGGRGAAYGGAAGAAVGLAGILLQRGPDLDLPRDMMFEVQLDEDLSVPAQAARRSVEIARRSQPLSSPQDSSSSGGDTTLPGDSAEPVPDFDDGKPETRPVETAKITTLPEPLPSPGNSTPPPGVDPSTVDDPNGYKLKVDVQLVMVDAMVRDRSGRPMDNLKREDFRVSEDGLEQQVVSFSRDQLPLAVALVVDRSGSVAPFMNELRRAAYKALSQLKRGDQVALYSFAGEVQRLEDLTTDRQRIADRISQIRAGGGTNIIDALFDAAYYLYAVAPNRRRAIILVSDNQATVRPRSSQNQLIRQAMESETVVYSIKTAGESLPLTMRVPDWLGGKGSVNKVTHETGGEIIDVERTGSLDAALADVVARLKLRYTLGYSTTNPARDGAFRKIDVRLADLFGHLDNDYSVHARRGYYAPTEKVAHQTKGSTP